MKFDISKPKDLQSNLGSDTFSSEIADPKVMMNIVRDKLYAHKLRTPIQEYISNAWDSHVAAGSTKRGIKVVLPTSLEPVLKIRDYGTGMSDEKVRKTYSQYTASDKRQNLNQIGGFGLGSKSAFAYTDKFTIVSFYNGIKNTYLAYAPSELDLEFTLLASEETTEENGVEIHIAIKPTDIAACHRYVLRMILLLPVKTELVNGSELLKAQNIFEGEALIFSNEDFSIYSYSKLGLDLTSAIDMNDSVFISYNNIPYQIPAKYTQIFRNIRDFAVNGCAFELKAPMNSLQIPPSREMLVDDEALEGFIKEQAEKITAWFKAKKQEEIELLKSKKRYEDLKDSLPKLLCYHPDDILVEIPVRGQTMTLVVTRGSSYSYNSSYKVHILTKEEHLVVNKSNRKRNSSTVVVNQDYRKERGEKSEPYVLDLSRSEKWYTSAANIADLSAENVAKLRYIFKNDSSLNSIHIFKANSPLAEFITNTIENFSLPKNAKLVPEYYLVEDYGDLNLGQVNFSPRKEYYYVVMNEENKSNLTCTLPRWVREELSGSGKIIIYLPEVTEALVAKKKNFHKIDATTFENRDPRKVKFSSQQLQALARIEEVNRHYYKHGMLREEFVKIYKFLKSSNINDPWLKELLEQREIVKELHSKYKMNLFSLPRDIQVNSEELDKEVIDCMNKYPLLKSINTYRISEEQGQEIEDYINLVHARSTGILKSE